MTDSGVVEPYRDSHRGPTVALDYDRSWAPGSAKHLEWQLERVLLRRIVEGAGPLRCALDFACGTGRVLAVLEQYAGRTVGVDVSPDMLARAREKCPRSTLVECDVTAGGWPRDAAELSDVDLVTAFRFFLNAEPELRAAALRWIRSVLAPAGLLVANFHLNPASARGTYLRLRWRGRRLHPMLSVAEAEALLNGAGFTVLARYGYSYLPFRRDGARLIAGRSRARVEAALLDKASLVPRAGAFVLVARPAGAAAGSEPHAVSLAAGADSASPSGKAVTA